MPPLSPEVIIEHVGQRIGELRRAKGWTQQELADALEVTMRYVQAVESGTKNLTLRSLVEVANALEVDLARLLDAPPKRKPRVGRPKKVPGAQRKR